ncbi:MAG: S9 family peptidase [Chloroflexi bacterium]|nr:S9 family peptidase [Chloroflexota bacterium]
MNTINADQSLDIVYIDDVRVSPDGTRAAFVRLSSDRSANENVCAIWIKDLVAADIPAQPFTTGRKDSSPRWSENNRYLGFLSNRNGEAAVYALPLSGGEAQCVATHQNSVSAFDWAPDGSRIAFVAPVRADERVREDEERLKAGKVEASGETAVPGAAKDSWDKKRDKEQREHDEAQTIDPRIVREFPYRTGTDFLNDRWSNLYVIDVPVSFAAENKAKAIRLTDADTNFSLPSWSRDGSALLSTMARRPEHTDIEYWYDLVKITVPTDSAKTAVETLIATSFSHSHPLVSPDGCWVAMGRTNQDKPEFRNHTLVIQPTQGGDVVDLTGALDRSVDQYVWSRDSRHLYFTLLKDGRVNLWRVSVLNGEIEQLTDSVQEITSFDVDDAGRIVFAAGTPQDPSALYLRELDGRIAMLYQPNAAFLSAHAVCPVDEVSYTSGDFMIQGWIIMPPDFDSTRKYPLALEIHGGPSAMWSASTRSMWHEWQTLAQYGYVVFFCNPRGSGGYGEKFLGANCGDWGDGPMHDILRGVDMVVARGYINADKMVVTGGSYGGYLTAWIVGRDQRFKAAVAQRGVYNLISMRGVTDIPYFNDRETGATPWEDVSRMWEMSPIALAPHVQTPLLLEHSEQDYRVPISQAEELYLALRSFKKTVELVRWPREGHELSRSGEPKHRVERIKRIVDWFDKYTADNDKNTHRRPRGVNHGQERRSAGDDGAPI